MIVSIVKEDKTYYFHKNIIIDENTTVSTYLDKIESSIQTFYDSDYPITAFNILQVKLWDYENINKSNGKTPQIVMQFISLEEVLTLVA
jgi:hypothetical protein